MTEEKVMINSISLHCLLATCLIAAVATNANATRLVRTVEGCQVVSTSDKPYSTSWDGQCSNGLANGRGTVIWSLDGNEYSRVTGNYVDGQVDGPVHITRTDGLRVDAIFANGEPTRAVIHYRDGGTYDGELFDYKPNGQGVMRYSNGNDYTGSWQAGKKSGRGVMHFSNGAKYEGEFSRDEFNGQGVMIYADGGVYDGNWLAGKRSGHGTLRSPNGKIYNGEFSDGNPTGNASAPPSAPVAIAATPVAAGTTGACHTDLLFLRKRFPNFTDPMLADAENSMFAIPVRTSISDAKAQGWGPEEATSAAMQNADATIQSQREATECAAATDGSGLGTTSEEFMAAIDQGKVDPDTQCAGVLGACRCAAIIGRMGAVAFRALAGEFQCYSRNGQW